MLGRMSYRALILVSILAISVMAQADNASLNQYLVARKSLSASSISLSKLKSNLSTYASKTVELKGTINGVVKSGDSMSFIMDCDGESILIKSSANPPGCMTTGNTVRVLAKLGPECVLSLTHMDLAGAVLDYDISLRESQLAAKAVKKPQTAINRDSNPKNFLSARQARGDNLTSRYMQIFDPYKRAIAQFNPKLTEQQLVTITNSILAFSEHYGVDPRLVVALILTESAFRPSATSHAGAMGLGQLMPGTAQGLGVRNAYDPVQNIEASIRLMRGHLGKYGDLSLALSAYNAGPGAVSRYGGVPPYRETRNYVRKVTQIYKALCGM